MGHKLQKKLIFGPFTALPYCHSMLLLVLLWAPGDVHYHGFHRLHGIYIINQYGTRPPAAYLGNSQSLYVCYYLFHRTTTL